MSYHHDTSGLNQGLDAEETPLQQVT